ncbi:MAG: SAF domain-containing protein [Micropruina sp.]|uniref:SAF domain-containing protein n=1 Tax=Micropruina sp. TaxID=2737536 RepID=UPI0039E6550A
MKALQSRVRRLLRRHRRLFAAVLAALAVWTALGVLRPPDPPSVSVLVAERALVGGRTVAAGDVAVRRLPASALPTDYLNDPDQALGRPLTVSIPAGTVLLPTSVVTKNALAAPGLAILPVTLTPTAAALVEVGDRIDLLASDAGGDPALVASAARVVAVLASGSDSSPLSPRQSAGPVVLVELRPDALAKVSGAAARGPLGFGLR